MRRPLLPVQVMMCVCVRERTEQVRERDEMRVREKMMRDEMREREEKRGRRERLKKKGYV